MRAAPGGSGAAAVGGALPTAVVITGSYNFTRAAQGANAENVIFVSGNPGVIDRYVANFDKHRSESKPWR